MVDPSMMHGNTLEDIKTRLRERALALGFQGLGVTCGPTGDAEARLEAWLAAGYHGDMAWMARHGRKRSRPALLVPGTVRVISARMDYLPHAHDAWDTLATPEAAFIARYALGRDYHKLLRRRLQQLASGLEAEIGPFGYRVFVDSAPVLEKPIAQAAGLGWIGKHTLLINRSAGSWFFLGEIYTDLPLPVDTPESDHCGSCRACIDICPTAAIVAPYQLDARRCIAYLTIEHQGSIPEALRPLIGNRVFGCDDCQLVCPWNKFARQTAEADFAPRHGLDASGLIALFMLDEAGFLRISEGSAIRRLGHPRWLRNLAVGLGNAAPSPAVVTALQARAEHPSALVREHVAWALRRQSDQPRETSMLSISRAGPSRAAASTTRS
jgi:epoxyqueuosine reductase